jgi:hypothetical protein
MTSENEFEQESMGFDHEGTRQMLRMSTTKPAPADLEQKIMLSVMAAGRRRPGKRVALARWLKFVAIVVLLVAMAKVMVPQEKVPQGVMKEIARGIGRSTENYDQLLDWLQHHSYLFIAPFVLWIVIKVKSRFGDHEYPAGK